MSGIASDLATMVHAEASDTAVTTAAKAAQIKSTFSVNSFVDTNKQTITYVSYTYKGETKYLFFSGIELMRSRSDESQVRESVNSIGFISNSNTIDDELNVIVSELTATLIKVNVIVCLVCLVIVLVVSIVASRYLADSVMDNIIRLCIKMKIAQTTQAKTVRMQARNQNKLEFTQKFYKRGRGALSSSENEVDVLFCVVEDIIKINNMKTFRLVEENSPEYNSAAINELSQILTMYEDALEKVNNDVSISPKRRVFINA